MTLKNQALVLEPQQEAVSTVFYFPGCGSERLFSRISRAAIYILLSQHHRVILPPPFLCCGYPFQVNAQTRKYKELVLKNIMVLTQIREMFNDLPLTRWWCPAAPAWNLWESWMWPGY